MNPLKFVGVAKAAAALSKDPSTKVGCVVVDDDGSVLSLGYNGFPRGVDDLPQRYADRDTKLIFVAHAESNAIAQAARHGVRLLGSTMVLTALYPCTDCAKQIIQAGIKRVYAPRMSKDVNEQWKLERDRSVVMFIEAGVTVEEYGP